MSTPNPAIQQGAQRTTNDIKLISSSVQGRIGSSTQVTDRDLEVGKAMVKELLDGAEVHESTEKNPKVQYIIEEVSKWLEINRPGWVVCDKATVRDYAEALVLEKPDVISDPELVLQNDIPYGICGAFNYVNPSRAAQVHLRKSRGSGTDYCAFRRTDNK